MSLLALERIQYRAGSWELDVSFALGGHITGLFGPSGSGKTTILEIIAGLRRPRHGMIRLGNDLLCDVPGRVFVAPEKRRIGYMPQDLALFPHRTVRQNLLFGSKAGEFDSARLDHLLDVLQIQPLLSRHPANLSGGEKQRVALGRALLSAPRLLLLDEPLANLHASLKQKLLALFRRTAEEFGTPMLYVTHDAGELAQLCREVVLIDEGKVTGQGSFETLFESTLTPVYQPRQNPGGIQM